MKRIVVLFCTILTSCSGGGSSDSVENFSGEYLFVSVKTADSCNAGSEQEIMPVYRLSQDGSSIVLTNLGTNATLSGSLVGNGWLASDVTNTPQCSVNTQVFYDGGVDGSIAIFQTCPGFGNCEVNYQSIVQRR